MPSSSPSCSTSLRRWNAGSPRPPPLLDVMERREELQRDQSGRTGEDRRTAERTSVRRSGPATRCAPNSTSCVTNLYRGATNSYPNWTLIWLRCMSASEPTGVRGPGYCRANSWCGACQIEIDRGELARISAAAEDEVLRCPECGAILLRESREPGREGRRRGRRRVTWEPGACGIWCRGVDGGPKHMVSPRASKRSTVPPTTLPNIAA